MTTSVLDPLSPIFKVLNWIALLGWSTVLVKIVTNNGTIDEEIDNLVFSLECICLVEVVRIILGDLPGNLVLGVVLHGIRLATIFQVLPRLVGDWTQTAVLASWAITEVTRYPMYMFPQSSIIRSIRMVVPLATFPIGAFSEAFAAFKVFKADDDEAPWWLSLVLVAVLFINVALGPTMAYPALLKKGLPILGLGRKSIKKKKVKRI
jgi:hypothetical protein